MNISNSYLKYCSLSLLALLVTQNSVAVADQSAEDQIVVTASGTATALKKAPASIDVITAQDIDKLPAQDVRDILKKVPGITIQHGGNLEKIQIRGLGDRYTLFLIDGKRVSSAPNAFRGNDFDAGWVPVEAIERIEVVKGPMSSLHGSDAIGGVVNIITKKEGDAWHGSFSLNYTKQENSKSGNYGRGSFSLTGPILKDQLFLKSYGSYDYRQEDDSDINPNPVIPGFYKSDDKFIDNTLTWLVDDQNELDFNYGYSNRLQDITRLERHALGITHRGEYDWGNTEIKLYGDRIHNHYGHGNRAQEDQPNTAYNLHADAKTNLAFDLGLPHQLTIGVSYNRQSVEDKFVLTGQGGTNANVWQASAFIEDTISVTDKFDVTVGNRLDYHKNFGTNFSPRLYGVYQLSDSVNLKGGWSTSFKAPTLLENAENWQQISCGGGCYMMGSEDLKPETGNSVELGINVEDDDVSMGMTFFHNDITNMIPFPPARTGNMADAVTYANFFGVSPDGLPQFTYENIDQAKTMGLEASLEIRPLDNLAIRTNYTYLDAKATSGVERPLAYQPRHSANIGLDWQATDELSFGVQANYTGSQYTYVPTNGDMSNAYKVDGYATADLTAQYDLNAHFSFKAGILNIADETVNRNDWNDFNIDGRRYYMSATARF